LKKIIYINSIDRQEVSGQGSFERNFLSFLESSSSDVEVKVFTINPSKNIITDKYISLRLNKSSKLSYLFYQINIFYFLIKEIRKNKNCTIYIRLAPFNLSPFLIASFFKIKITVRSGPIYQNLSLYNKVNNAFLLKVFKYFLNYFYKKTQDIIVVTEKIKELLIHDFNLNPAKIHVISNPINNTIFGGEVDAASIRKKINIDSKEKVIGFVGDVYKDQGVQHIFTSLIKVKESININNVKVIIVGSGTYLEDCKHLVSKLNLTNNVIFLGRVSPKEVIDYISIFDICLAPFTKRDYEVKGSSALKILEYLYCNKFVITIDVDEYKFIKEKGFGWLYKIDDLDDLSKKISVGLKSSLKIDSKDYVLNHFSKEKVFSKYLKIIKNN
jgi:glycosyltransferase involved in cell wall biosynthesis